MSEKVLVQLFNSFGKGDGNELFDEYVINNTEEERADVIDDFGRYDFVYTGSEEGFIDGSDSYFEVAISGGDWDEPTGKSLIIKTQADVERHLKNDYETRLNGVRKLFKDASNA